MPTLTGSPPYPPQLVGRGNCLVLPDEGLHHLEVFGGRQLDVRRLARDDRHHVAGGRDELGVVVADQPGVSGLAMSAGQQLVSETLRGLRQHDQRAVEALDKAIPFDALDGVSRRDRGECRARLHRRRQNSTHQCRRGERAGGVVHQHVVAVSERRQARADRVLPALASRPDHHGLARLQRVDLALGKLQAAGWPDDHDAVDLVQRQEQLEDARQRRASVQADQRLAAAAETRAGARRGDDRTHRRGAQAVSSRGLTRAGRLESAPVGSAKIIRPAEVWITDVTTAVMVWLSRRRPFWMTTMVPSSRLPTPWPGSLPSRATVTTISSPGIATGRIACASSLRFNTATPSRRAMRLRLKSLVMIAQPLRLAVRTRWASMSPLGAVSSSVTWRLIDGSFCMSVRTSRPRRPRRRRVTSAESAPSGSSRRTEVRITNGMSTKPVLPMSRMRPSMMTEVSRRTPVKRWPFCSAERPKKSEVSSERRVSPTEAPWTARRRARINESGTPNGISRTKKPISTAMTRPATMPRTPLRRSGSGVLVSRKLNVRQPPST